MEMQASRLKQIVKNPSIVNRKTNRKEELFLNFSLIASHYPLLHSKINNLGRRNASFEFDNTMFHITRVEAGPLQHIYVKNYQVNIP